MKAYYTTAYLEGSDGERFFVGDTVMITCRDSNCKRWEKDIGKLKEINVARIVVDFSLVRESRIAEFIVFDIVEVTKISPTIELIEDDF